MIHTHCINQCRKKWGSVQTKWSICVHLYFRKPITFHLLIKTRAISCNVIEKKININLKLFVGSWWKVIKALWLDKIAQVSLFVLTGEAEIVNVVECGKDWHLTRCTKCKDAESCPFQSLWKFTKISRKVRIFIWLNRCAES